MSKSRAPDGAQRAQQRRAAERRRTLSARLSVEQAAWIHSHCHGPTTVSVFLRQLVQQAMLHERAEVQRIQARLKAQRLQPRPAPLLAADPMPAQARPERL